MQPQGFSPVRLAEEAVQAAALAIEEHRSKVRRRLPLLLVSTFAAIPMQGAVVATTGSAEWIHLPIRAAAFAAGALFLWALVAWPVIGIQRLALEFKAWSARKHQRRIAEQVYFATLTRRSS